MGRHAVEESVAVELARKRARMFVGRGSEKRLFSRLLQPSGELRALFVHGIGGVGKTTLLNEFQRLTPDRNVACMRADARELPDSPQALRHALSFFLHGDDARGLRVLLLDNFEFMAPLEAWFRDDFLARLPGGRRVVVAGRKGPAAAWTADPGWAALTRILALSGFTQGQGEDYLRRRKVPAQRRGQVLGFARGHPLALALSAELLAQQPAAALPPEAEQEILALLMHQLLRGIDDLQQLQALRALAVVRQLNAPLLAHMLARDNVDALYDWLGGLSFVQSGSDGLVLHSLLRDAITFDLRRRDRVRYDLMAGRAFRFLLRQMATRPPAQCGPAAVDVLFVQRDTHMARTIYRFEEERQCYCDAPSEGEWPQIQDMVLRHEGEAALAILDHWVKRQPQGLIAVRDAHRALVGFLFQLEVNGLTAADAAPDPVMLRFLGYLDQREAMQAHERAILVRSWMAADGYQALSAVQTQVCAYIMLATLTTANLAYVLHLQPDVEAWTRISAECGQTRLPGPAVTIGRYRAALYAHDYRQETALEWMCGLHRSLRGLPAPGAVALDQEAFAAAVRQALKDYVSPRALADNPLLAAALVARNPEAPGENPVEVLRGLLHSHCEYLKTSPRTAALYKILHRSYLQPARNQALAAEALYLSERTYRRRLAQALEQVAASLWLTEQELV